MQSFAIQVALLGVLSATTRLAGAAEAERTNTVRETQRISLALSAAQSFHRAGPPADLRFNQSSTIQFVAASRFTQEERKRLRAFHDEYVADHSAPLPAALACPQAQRYAQGILDRLIDASALRQAMQQADYPVHLVVTCGVADLPDAEMKAGVLEVSAELILEMESEDEIASMLAHELAHYTLAHAAKTLEVHARLTPHSARVLSVGHEFEADAEGLILLTNAGYDPYAAIDALLAMRNVLRTRHLQAGTTHPNLDDRIHRLRQQISRADWLSLPRRTRGLSTVQDELRKRPIALLQKREGAR